MTRRWVGPAAIAAMLLFTAIVYASLPERIATHWDVNGVVDGWSSRVVGSLLAPVVALLIWLLLPALRRIDPRRRNYDRFDPTFRLVINLFVLFMGVIHVLTLGFALGLRIDMARAIPVLAGLLLAGLGNYLPRLRSNWWMGIRTPWTLESELVWRSTHRVAGFTFVVAGVLVLTTTFLPSAAALPVIIGAVAAAVIIPLVYSFVAYRRERGGTSDVA